MLRKLSTMNMVGAREMRVRQIERMFTRWGPFRKSLVRSTGRCERYCRRRFVTRTVSSEREGGDVVARLDMERERRTSVPEVVFAEGKSYDQMLSIFRSLSESGRSGGRAMATRVSADVYDRMSSENGFENVLRYYSTAKIMCIDDENVMKRGESEDDDRKRTKIAVVSAGTSDAPVAEEAAVSAELLIPDAHVERLTDVGVAGIHRLLDRAERIMDSDIVICVAGMDGALPSVVGGLVPCPVLAVPTSVGYGAAWNGLSPLLTMLNSCAPGVAVMNIDNGFGAAAFAAKFLRSSETRRVATI